MLSVWLNLENWRLMALTTTCALLGCVATSSTFAADDVSASRPAPATAREVRASMQAVSACLRTRAAELDDGTSDPLILGRRVASGCDEPYRRMIAVQSQGRDADTTTLMARLYLRNQNALATRMVVAHRRDTIASGGMLSRN